MRDAIRTKAFQIPIAGLMFVLGICTVAVTQTAMRTKTSSSSAREAMINVLASGEPNPSLGEEAQTFDRFVGTWGLGLPRTERRERFTTAKENCISAGYSMAERSRICGLPTQQQIVRNARLGQRFGSLIRRSINGALCSFFQNSIMW